MPKKKKKSSKREKYDESEKVDCKENKEDDILKSERIFTEWQSPLRDWLGPVTEWQRPMAQWQKPLLDWSVSVIDIILLLRWQLQVCSQWQQSDNDPAGSWTWWWRIQSSVWWTTISRAGGNCSHVMLIVFTNLIQIIISFSPVSPCSQLLFVWNTMSIVTTKLSLSNRIILVPFTIYNLLTLQTSKLTGCSCVWVIFYCCWWLTYFISLITEWYQNAMIF